MGEGSAARCNSSQLPVLTRSLPVVAIADNAVILTPVKPLVFGLVLLASLDVATFVATFLGDQLVAIAAPLGPVWLFQVSAVSAQPVPVANTAGPSLLPLRRYNRKRAETTVPVTPCTENRR